MGGGVGIEGVPEERDLVFGLKALEDGDLGAKDLFGGAEEGGGSVLGF